MRQVPPVMTHVKLTTWDESQGNSLAEGAIDGKPCGATCGAEVIL